MFFFKQKTAYEMRISDWSSDVCSSELPAKLAHTAVCTKDAACVLFIATELPFDEVTDLAHMDADRDARVSLAEFQDRFYDFDAMDRNHDQVLSRDEPGPNGAPKPITRPAFRAQLAKMLQAWDHNGDGYLDTSEGNTS